MSTRSTDTLITSELAAIVELHPRDRGPQVVWGTAKRTYRITERGLVLDEAQQLRHDLRREDLNPRRPPGSDFWPFKHTTDVVVQGSAYATGGRPVYRSQVAVKVHRAVKRIDVWGRRELEWATGRRPRIAAPEPFVAIEISAKNAYGGEDRRVPAPLPKSIVEEIRLLVDRPGMYPRNPFGKGYVVYDSPVDGIELPNLEDPGRALTAHTIIVHNPANWYQQPLPWTLDWLTTSMFPRVAYAGERPWYPVPGSTVLEEVRRGLIPRGWRTLAANLVHGDALPPIFFQEASLGMTFSNIPAGAPFEIEGMHPECHTVRFSMPDLPRFEIEVEGNRQQVQVRPIHVVISPDEKMVEITWAGVREGLSRVFIPGLHGEIPIALYVDGVRVPYATPRPIRSRLQEAEGRRRALGFIVPPTRRPGERSESELRAELSSAGAPRRERDQWDAPTRPMVGPLEIVGGRVVRRELDWCLSGAAQFAFVRSYSSSMSWRPGALGLGWAHSLEQAAWWDDRAFFLRVDDGRELCLREGEGELGIGQRAHHAESGITVVRIADDAYEVRYPNGSRSELSVTERPERHGNATARLTRLIGCNGVPLDVRYDLRGRLERLVLTTGEYARFEYDERGRLSRVFLPAHDGRQGMLVARYECDALGQLRKVMDGSGRAIGYAYSGGLLTHEVRDSGLSWSFVYDTEGDSARCRFQRWGDVKREVYWDAGEKLAGIEDATRQFRSISARPDYQVERVRDWFGNETKRVYDENCGLLVAQSAPDGETRFLYDAAHHLAEVVHPDGGSDALEHDAFGHLTFWANADGHAARWGWDHLGRLGAAIDRAGASVVYEYDEEGPLSAVLAPGEVRLMLIRDPRSHAVAELRSVTGSRYAMHDALTRIIETRDELGAVHRVRYDPCGRVAQVQLPTGAVRGFESDGDGRVTSVRDETGARVFERDGFGRIVHIDEGNGGARLHRDAEGRVTMVESEAGDFWELSRDAAGRAQSELGFSGEEVHIQRDHNGRIIRELRGATRSRVVRDVMGRPTNIEHGDETFQRFGWTKAGWLAHAQEADREVVLERDGEGRVLVEKQGTHWVRSEYDACGRRVRVSSSFGLVTAIERDVFGGAVSMTAERAEQRLELRFARDATGKERVRYLPGGLEARSSRDALGRVVERSLWNESGRISALGFTWAGVDRLVRVQEPGGVREHQHDARGRLVAARGQVRAMDEVGNVFRVRECDDHRYGPGGQLLEGYGVEYGYDAEGRRVEKKTLIGDPNRYRWDSLGRLVEVALSPDARVVYDYDAFGRMVRRRHEQRVEVPGLEEPVWDALRETQFIWDGLKLLHEIEGEQVTTWLWEEGVLVGKLDPEGAFAVLTDPLGMPTDVLDQRGEVAWRGNVDVFGVALSDVRNTSCPWRFPGHWEDPETGLSHSLFRVYDPETGAYLSPSPLGIAGGANLYAYVYDPLSEASPLGLARGYDSFAGALRSERLGAELVDITIRALDRGDGAAGPRSRFDPEAAGPILPDPEAILWGPWERYRPVRRLPPSTSSFTRLPDALGFNERD